ncbi:trigger factor [Candidatus Saccharibacteria bacterium oral taxon 955]|nr:trigger factor [Candidatus Saccharibacteria bacterium oral taxon 955]QJU05901.1 trigger factor [Candidatus Saccharibacteria bacterium oral taxon 955]
MNTTVKYLSDTRVRATIKVEATELKAAEQVALKKLSKTVKVNGFRKGHVPLEVVKKNVDLNALAQETLENALSRAVAESFIENKLQALERPEVEVKKFVPGESLEFTAEADVLPKVKLGDYKKLKATEKKISVAKKDVDEVVERIRKSMAEKKEVKRAAKLGDEAVIDFVGKKDGEAFPGGTGNDYPLELGSGSFIPGFEEAIIGLKAGDKKDIELTFPKDYHAPDLKGKKVVFETTVKKINEKVLPELNDEFAAKTGPFTSMSELTADIKRELEAQKKRKASDELKDSLVKQLVAKSNVAVPAVLREDQVRSIEQDLMQNLMYQGLSIEQYWEQKGYKDRDAWVKAEANEAADNRIKAGLVLSELSKVLKIEATADELADHLNTYRKQYANNPEMAKRFEEPEVQREVANRLITEKTVDELVKLNTK